MMGNENHEKTNRHNFEKKTLLKRWNQTCCKKRTTNLVQKETFFLWKIFFLGTLWQEDRNPLWRDCGRLDVCPNWCFQLHVRNSSTYVHVFLFFEFAEEVGRRELMFESAAVFHKISCRINLIVRRQQREALKS